MRAGRWWSGVGWAARLRDATAPTVRCSPRRSAEHQLAMATCDSDADDQIMNLQNGCQASGSSAVGPPPTQWMQRCAVRHCGGGGGGVACVRRLSKTRTRNVARLCGTWPGAAFGVGACGCGMACGSGDGLPVAVVWPCPWLCLWCPVTVTVAVAVCACGGARARVCVDVCGSLCSGAACNCQCARAALKTVPTLP